MQLCEAVRGSADDQLAEHGIAALQAVAQASVTALRCGDSPQQQDALDAVTSALSFLLHELQGPCAAKAHEARTSAMPPRLDWKD